MEKKFSKNISLSILFSILLFIAGCTHNEFTNNKYIEDPESKKQDLEKQILLSCKIYDDVCNTCSVIDGVVTGCTEMFCSDEIKIKPTCILYNDKIIIGKILEIKIDEIHIIQGDIVKILKINKINISKFKLEDSIEAVYNENSNFENILSRIYILKNPIEENLICTKEYMPVCAQTRTDKNNLPILETFSNNCMAQNARIIHNGVCGDDSHILTQTRLCTQEYAPICVEFNGGQRTMSNSCFTDILTKISDGKCQ